MSAATPAYPPPVRARSSLREVLAVLMLTFGSLLVGIGWLVGVGLLWSSDRWRVSEKVLGTLVWPFGYAGVLGAPLVVGGFLLVRAHARALRELGELDEHDAIA